MPQAAPNEIKAVPAYSIADAARYLAMKAPTVRDWFRGPNAILHNSRGYISFIELIEAHVLHTVRKTYRIPMGQVRKAAETLKQLNGSLEFLAYKDFYHDKKNLFLEIDSSLVSLSERGQCADKEILKEGLKQLEYGEDGFTELYFPKAHDGSVQRDFAVSPKMNYGRLCIARLGVGVDVLHDRFCAGETMSDIGADFGANQSEVEEALRWHGRLAA